MKITTKQYAEALYEAVRNKSQIETKSAINNFAGVLTKNGQLKLKDEIIGQFKKTYNEKNGIIEAEIISREKLSSQLFDEIKTFLKNKYQAKEVIVKNKTDAKIKGGIIIKVGNEIIDGSVNKQLINLKKKLSQ